MKIKTLTHPSRVLLLVLVLLAVLSILLLGNVSAAPASGYSLALAQPVLDWWTVDAGGGASLSGSYQLSGAVAQPEGGVLTGGNYRLQGGFWQEDTQQGATFKVHLPLVVR